MLLLTSFDSNEAQQNGDTKIKPTPIGHVLVIQICVVWGVDRDNKNRWRFILCSLLFPVIFHMESQTFCQLISNTDILIIIYGQFGWLC